MMRAIILEELACADAALMLSLPGFGLGNEAIAAVATEDQMERFGKKWAAMAITEPEAGSDSGAIKTTAVLDGNEWILNGEKIFITDANRCEVVVVWASLDRSAGKSAIRSFVVEKGTPGFTVEKLEHKMGLRASETGTLVFQDCRIPKENILGSPEIKKTTEGFKGVLKTFDNTRPMAAVGAVGVGKASLELLKEHMEEDGLKIDYNQNANNIGSIEEEYYLAEANLEASRLLAWKALWMADNGKFNSLEASMSKAKAARSATLIAQKVCDLLGPLGYTRKNLAEKWMRDVKVLDIFEGTGQIQHLIVARNILGLSSRELK
jgi:acyl-CoA dehydrogenase